MNETAEQCYCHICETTYLADDYQLHREHSDCHAEGTTTARKEKAKEMIGDAPNGDCVYVLEIERWFDKKSFYYVGISNSLIVRIAGHMDNGAQIAMPTGDRREERQRYVVRDVERVVETDSRAEARNLERETALKVAIEKNTTKVVGGR